MTYPYVSHLRLPAIAVLTALLGTACSNSDNNSSDDSSQPIKRIVWTEYGIPHVTAADDWGSLGYGVGNAFAQLNFCSYKRDIVRANGQSAELLGDDGNLEYDFVMKMYNTDDAIERVKAVLSDRGRAMYEGYAAGVSRYLQIPALIIWPRVRRAAEASPGFGKSPCDVMKSAHKTLLRASGDVFYNELVAASPPDQLAAITPIAQHDVPALVAQMSALTPQQVADRLGVPSAETIAVTLTL